jgi:sulfur-oxidizing protein SoxA
MKKIITMAMMLAASVATASTQNASVQNDIDAFQNYFASTFPNMTKDQFSNGSYQFSEDKLLQYEAQMDMPAFEDSLEKGEELWGTPFANGKTYSSCFKGETSDIRTAYPHWDAKTKGVITLEATLNKCRTDNGEKKMGWKKGNMAFISAYLNTAAAGHTINVIVPDGDADAYAAYLDGKNTFYTKRGQLNLSCADCHVYSSSKRIRGNILSGAMGHVTHFPVWRGKWAAKKGNGYGTIQRRYGGCYKQVRATPAKAQQPEYNNLEYFHTSMSNGMQYVGTEYRE